LNEFFPEVCSCPLEKVRTQDSSITGGGKMIRTRGPVLRRDPVRLIFRLFLEEQLPTGI